MSTDIDKINNHAFCCQREMLNCGIKVGLQPIDVTWNGWMETHNSFIRISIQLFVAGMMKNSIAANGNGFRHPTYMHWTFNNDFIWLRQTKTKMNWTVCRLIYSIFVILILLRVFAKSAFKIDYYRAKSPWREIGHLWETSPPPFTYPVPTIRRWINYLLL